MRDEYYVIDLCDAVLGIASSRQHRFPFLTGDPGRDGSCRRLPVDAFYEPLALAVELEPEGRLVGKTMPRDDNRARAGARLQPGRHLWGAADATEDCP